MKNIAYLLLALVVGTPMWDLPVSAQTTIEDYPVTISREEVVAQMAAWRTAMEAIEARLAAGEFSTTTATALIDLRAKIERLGGLLTSARTDRNQMRLKLERIRAERLALQTSLTAEEGKTTELAARIAEKDKKIASLETQLAATLSGSATDQSAIALLLVRLSELDKDLAAALARVASLEEYTGGSVGDRLALNDYRAGCIVLYHPEDDTYTTNVQDNSDYAYSILLRDHNHRSGHTVLLCQSQEALRPDHACPTTERKVTYTHRTLSSGADIYEVYTSSYLNGLVQDGFHRLAYRSGSGDNHPDNDLPVVQLLVRQDGSSRPHSVGFYDLEVFSGGREPAHELVAAMEFTAPGGVFTAASGWDDDLGLDSQEQAIVEDFAAHIHETLPTVIDGTFESQCD